MMMNRLFCGLVALALLALVPTFSDARCRSSRRSIGRSVDCGQQSARQLPMIRQGCAGGSCAVR